MSFNFPPEIEDVIFELAASSDTGYQTGGRLTLVSKRVNTRIEPILYKTLMFGGKRDGPNVCKDRVIHELNFLPTLRSKPASFFHNTVKNLFILTYNGISEEFRRKILSVCTGVEHLSLYDYEFCSEFRKNSTEEDEDSLQMWDLVTAMPLRSLECMSVLYYALPWANRVVFPNLNYLSVADGDIITDRKAIEDEQVLKHLPSLTHLAIRPFGSDDEDYDYNGILADLENLTSAPLLQSVLVLLDNYHLHGTEETDDVVNSYTSFDERFQVIDSRRRPALIWKERVTKGVNDFTGEMFNGHVPKPDGWEYDASMIMDEWSYHECQYCTKYRESEPYKEVESSDGEGISTDEEWESDDIDTEQEDIGDEEHM